ncbi:glutathione S-transferase omega-1-like [Saccostrea echinata]|uniref:glutathione S-transferase omega-1-like n=1 Tax=Saccostrea echinata TaxID=191078 RepID=UPI002A831FA3|nr:glutathione S-transferase omega-1-like [Saccostrea echinata]
MPTEKAFSAGSDVPELEIGKLRVYSMRFCPYAERTLLVLTHKNIPHEVVNINLKSKPDWFLQKNPIGKVPVLEQDDKIVYESLICCDYLDQVYPQNKLTPEDPYRQARDKMLIEHFSQLTTDFYKTLQAPPEEKPAGLKKILDQLSRFETEIEKRGDFFGGEQVMMIDFMIWPWFERFFILEKVLSQMIVTGESMPKLYAWTQRMLGCSAVQECRHPEERHLAFFQSYKTGVPNYDVGLEE